MTLIDPDTGLFAGLSRDDKATAVLDHLSMDTEITLQGLMEATGLTSSQVHAGIRHLRVAGGDECVITDRRGANSTYRLAENALEVREYANRRMRHWRSQIQTIQAEMDSAMRLLPDGDATKVLGCQRYIEALLGVLEMNEAMDKELERRERALERRAARLSRRPRQRASV